jgi:hypothetical protein
MLATFSQLLALFQPGSIESPKKAFFIACQENKICTCAVASRKGDSIIAMKRVQSFWLAIGLLLALLFTACSTSTVSSTTNTHPVMTAGSSTRMPGGPDCHPASPVSTTSFSMPQVQGKVSGGELWALIFNGWPMQARRENKIVWRMTGKGELHLVAYGPGGRTIQPTDLVPHSGSNWRQPGNEWGSFFTFPVPGCWDVHATRDNISGDVWFLVQ